MSFRWCAAGLISTVLAILAVILILSFASQLLVGQETTASLQGYVKDTTGAFLPGADLELSSPALLQPKKARTNGEGAYYFDHLPPGTYTLEVSANNFRTSRVTGLDLSVGRTPTVTVTLQVGALVERIDVSAAAPFIDPTSSKSAVVVGQLAMENLPKSRTFESLIPLAPGARSELLQSGSRLTSHDLPGFQVDGASDGENTFLLDGADTTETIYAGLSRLDTAYTIEFVEEVQVKTAGFEAQYGGAIGGVVNVIQKRGSNQWHGSVFSSYFGDRLTASDYPTLRENPATPANEALRTPSVPEYYQPKQDAWHRIDGGFTVGGFVWKNKLWFFAGYDPQMYRTSRTINFMNQTVPADNGPHTFHQSQSTHTWQARLDGNLGHSLRLYGSVTSAFQRIFGAVRIPTADSPYGQVNETALTSPNTYADYQGFVFPTSLWSVGGDWTLTPTTIIAGRFSNFYQNYSERGYATGLRYLFGVASPATAFDGTPIPEAFRHSRGWSNIGTNYKTLYEISTRRQMSFDLSTFKAARGTHNLKFGYESSRIGYSTAQGYDTGAIVLYEGRIYTPSTDSGRAVCMHLAGKPTCAGNYGYYRIGDLGTLGKISNYNHAVYGQNAWTLAKRLTLNLGIRFEHENIPAVSPGYPKFTFGWGQKFAPRLGAALDVLGNSKWKVYGSYGKFFDIMKYALPLGSSGISYFQLCIYTLDNPDYTLILPQRVNGRMCPGTAGTRPGSLIEIINNAGTPSNDPNNPMSDPNLRPMQQHEFTIGSSYAVTPRVGIEVRYTRKRLDYAIEDNGVMTDAGLLAYIGNPGYGIARDLLQRTTGDASGSYPPLCPTCPYAPKASRKYDGIEFTLTKQYGNNWFGQVSYTYSRLTGNYSGLTSTFSYDGGGGRHGPNVSASFDLPTMQFTAHGTRFDGPLPTDRPHTLKLFGAYTLKWFGMQSTLGLTQSVYAGTPVTTGWDTTDAGHPQFVENQGNFVKLHVDPATGDLVSDGVIHDYRTPVFTQTNLQLSHEFLLSKSRESLRLRLGLNATNLLNQHAKISFATSPLNSGHAEPFINGDPNLGVDYLALTKTGWNYIKATNDLGLTFNGLYGSPTVFQQSRQVYVSAKISF